MNSNANSIPSTSISATAATSNKSNANVNQSNVNLNLPPLLLPVVDDIIVLNNRQRQVLLHRIALFSNRLELHSRHFIKKNRLSAESCTKLNRQLELIKKELCCLAGHSRLECSEDIEKYSDSKQRFFQLLVTYCKIIMQKEWDSAIPRLDSVRIKV